MSRREICLPRGLNWEACFPKGTGGRTGGWGQRPSRHSLQSLPGISEPVSLGLSMAVSSYLSESLTLVILVLCLVRLLGTAPGTVGSGTVGWLVQPCLPPPSPSSYITIPISASPWLCPSFLFGAFLSISQVSSTCLSPSLSLLGFEMSFFPIYSFVSLHLLSLPISVSPYLCLSPISVSLGLCPPKWVRVGPGQPGPGAEENNAPFTRPVGAMATRPPRPPCARAASAKRMPWLRQARARPARRRPARSWRGQTGRGRQAAASAGSGGVSSKGPSAP